MNFVETSTPIVMSSIPSMAAEVEATPAVEPVKSNGVKEFFAGMALTFAIFPFTLVGMMTVTNVVVDHYIGHKAVVASQEFSRPLSTPENAADFEEAPQAVSANR